MVNYFLDLLILNNIALGVVVVTLCKQSCYNNISLDSCYNNISLDYCKALKQTLPLIGFPVMYQVLSWIALANRIYQASISGKYMKWMFFGHAITSASWPFFAGLFTIFYLIALSEFRKKKFRYNVMQFTRVFCKCCVKRKKKVGNSDVSEYERILGPDSEDHFTQYGITVTAPTSYPFVSESHVEREYDKQMN